MKIESSFKKVKKAILNIALARFGQMDGYAFAKKATDYFKN